MSSFSCNIASEDKQNATVPPPPELKRDGTLIGVYPLGKQRYADLAIEKDGMAVCVDEELDIYDHPGSLRHYRMTIRCMPYRADLNIIMAAARHMLLVSKYEISLENRMDLDPIYESTYWDVRYQIARDQMRADDDTYIVTDIYVPFLKRRRIWMELFEAMGYHVRWGSSVLNVRKKR